MKEDFLKKFVPVTVPSYELDRRNWSWKCWFESNLVFKNY